MSNDTRPDDTPESAPDAATETAPEAAGAQAPDANGSAAQAAPRKRRRGGMWLLLLALLVALGAWLLASGRIHLPASVQARLPDWMTPAPHTPHESPAPRASRQPKAAQPAAESAPARPVARRPAAPARAPLDAAEAEALMQAIDALRARLEEESAARASFEAEQRAEQRANLITRLRWIADPASRLPQIRLAWEEIALLPALTDDERATANDMAALARKDEARLRAWQAALARWIDALQTPATQDVLPRPAHPWLAWIVGQFHLRPSDAPAARETRQLRMALIEASRRLALEDWPEDREWQRLRARLLLKLEAMAKHRRAEHGADSVDAAIDPGLPESFRAIRADSERLTNSARQWLARLLPQADAAASAEEAL